MEKYKVSLIIAVYNGEKYLRYCLNSIRNQTYKNFEVIMIDDGSNDMSGKICDEFTKLDKRFSVIHQKNQGCSIARNCGLEKISGDFVGIIDQDDYLHEDYITFLMSIIEKYNVEIATTSHLNNFIGEPPIQKKVLNNEKIKIVDGNTAAHAMLLYTLQIGPWNKLIKRTLIEENLIRFQENFYCGEGFAFSIECFQAATKVAISNQAVYYYRIDNVTSGSSTFSVKKYESSLNAQEYMRKKMNDKSRYSDRVLRYSRWKTISDYYTLLKVSGVEKKFEKEYNEMRKHYRENALLCFVLPTTFKQKLRTLLFFISPDFAVKLLKIRINMTTGGKYTKK